MAKNHKWIGHQCIKCGLLRTLKTEKLLMAIVNHPPWNVYKYTQYYEYNNGFVVLLKRPDCKKPAKESKVSAK